MPLPINSVLQTHSPSRDGDKAELEYVVLIPLIASHEHVQKASIDLPYDSQASKEASVEMALVPEGAIEVQAVLKFAEPTSVLDGTFGLISNLPLSHPYRLFTCQSGSNQTSVLCPYLAQFITKSS